MKKCTYCTLPIKHEFREKFCNLKCKLKSKRNIVDDCWLWTGLVSGRYGRIGFNGIYLVSHRASFMVFVGDIPEKYYVYHSCHNNLCMNPQHLFLDKSPYFKLIKSPQPENENVVKRIVAGCSDFISSIKNKLKMGVK